MSVWTTKALSRDKEYIVLKHKLRGINYVVQGIKFRDGYAVVEKNSKSYFMLKKMPILQSAQEFPLIHLRKLKFVTRTADVKMIFGQDVYRHYLNALSRELNKESDDKRLQEELEHIDLGGCAVRGQNGELCQHDALPESPSGYCKLHILDDPRLKDAGVTIPKYVTKEEKAPLKEKVIKQLNKQRKEEKQDGEDIGEDSAESQ